MSQPRPVNVTADGASKVLSIEWSDKHLSAYPYAGLRAVCPCVECRGGHEHMGQPPSRSRVRDARNPELGLTTVEQVGGYALQFFWSDGHSTGIYTWNYLRLACPCPECLPE